MMADRVNGHSDWASTRRGQLVGWAFPATGMVVGGVLDVEAVVWPAALAWMGGACLANARRCGRMHCFFTGPFLLAMAALALAVGLDVVSLGARGWGWIGGGTLAGAVLLYVVPEHIWGRYRARAKLLRRSREKIEGRARTGKKLRS